MATERWLRSKSPEKWAAAMMQCQHPFGVCGQDGECHYNGDCFEGVAVRCFECKGSGVLRMNLENGKCKPATRWVLHPDTAPAVSGNREG